MRFALPEFVRRHTRLLFAIVVAIATAASTTFAQLGSFDSSFDGELWGVRRNLVPANNGAPAGVLFVNGTLYVVDYANDTVIAYDAAGNVVAKPGAQWTTSDAASPVAGMELHALGGAVVNVNGTDRNALLISSESDNRVAAFDEAGAHLFTLRLARPATVSPMIWLTLGQVAMAPGSKFTFTTAPRSLTLNGRFAAGWYEGVQTGDTYSGAMVLSSATAFVARATEFDATPDAILTGNENAPAAPDPLRFFGVTFDNAGNLYALDAFTERLHVYGPTLERLFTFGTPIAGGGTAEFFEPWGLAYWPDASGGRIFVNDTYNSRILVYRPTDTAGSAPGVDSLQPASVIKGFAPAVPKLSLFAIAVDPATATIAVSDYADGEDGGQPRTVVLQQPRLAAFNLHVLDANNAVTNTICLGENYKVRFSLTVPPGKALVRRVTPELSVNGTLTTAAAVPAATYPSPLTLNAGEVATFTYSLTASANQDITLLAGATSSSTTDVIARGGFIYVADCAGETGPSTITATPNIPPQVSGWTPVRANQAYMVTLAADDADGIGTIEYRIEGANYTGDLPREVDFDGLQVVASVGVALPQYGRSTLRYRVRDGNGIWSPVQTLNVRPTLVVDRLTNENGAAEFRVGDPEGTGFTYSVTGLPPGASFATTTGQFSGVISFDAVNPYSSDPILSSGVYPVVITETAPGGATSSVGFTWTINHLNRPPIITNPPVVAGSLTINQGASFAMQINGMDPDGDPSVFSLHGRGVNEGHVLPSTVTIDPVTGLISGVFPLDADPAYDFSVSLAECGVQLPTPPCNVALLPGARQATFFDFRLEVLDVNQPPDIVNPGPKTNGEGDAVTLAIQASDPEGDLLSFVASGLPPGLSIARLDSETAVISGTVAWGSAGTYAVTVEADDHVNLPKRSVTFSWVITHTNRPPSLTIPDRLNFENQSVSGSVTATDPDATDTLTFSATGLPPGASMSSTGVLSGAFDYAAGGEYTVTVTVSDGNAQVSDTFLWTVLNVNRKPVLAAVPQFSTEGETVSVTLTATDPDNDVLTFNALSFPPDLSFNASTGVISGTLGFNSARVYTVGIGVYDGTSWTLGEFVWTVTESAPVVGPIANQHNLEGAVIALPPIPVSDPDGDLAFTFSASNLPPGLSINPLNGAITGTLPYTAVGSYSVSITVSDANGGVTVVPFTWTVENVNRPPDVVNPGQQTSSEGATVSRQTVASDPDGQTVTYSATGLPAGLTIHSTTGVISGTIEYSAAPSYSVTVTASDGSLLDSETFVWIVNNVNRTPSAADDAATVVQGQSVVVSVLGNDSTPGGLTLTVTSVTKPTTGTAVISADGQTITYIAAPATFIGTATFSYTVSNDEATAEAQVTVTVQSSNANPVCSAASGGEIWPPNHKRFYAAPITGVTDPDGDALTIQIDGVWQDEPLDSTGDGQFSPDARIENGTVWLRAERNGHGNKAPGDGRVYAILFTATDNKGGSCSGSVLWSVPHDQGQRSTAIQGNAQYDSTGALAGTRDKSQIHQKSPLP